MVILDILRSIFGSVWAFFTELTVPGLGVSFGTLLVAVIIIRISIFLFHAATGGGGSSTGYRSGSSDNVKISDSRRGDQL